MFQNWRGSGLSSPLVDWRVLPVLHETGIKVGDIYLQKIELCAKVHVMRVVSLRGRIPLAYEPLYGPIPLNFVRSYAQQKCLGSTFQKTLSKSSAELLFQVIPENIDPSQYSKDRQF